MAISVKIDNVAGAIVIALAGEYDASNCQELAAALTSAVGREPRVVLDLRDTEYFDSSAFSVLIRSARASRERVRLVLPESGIVRRLFDLSGLEQYFRVSPSIEEATTGD